ncbi:MAG: carboxypeptidase regulatory-like domain-containing protein [Planctomycetes bacterium]|nr:carboxypeptidase regulatory-like domain-containing protein [Planctomycetota bacterium]
MRPPEPEATAAAASGPNVIVARVLDDETGHPVTAFTVKAVPHGDTPAIGRLSDEPGRPQPVNAVAGICRIESRPGTWDVVVQAAGYLPGELTAVAVPRPDARPLELRLSHGPSLTGTLVDDSGQAIPDAPVFLHVLRLDGPDKPPRNALATTDHAGRFRFSPLPQGLYALSAIEPDGPDRTGNLAVGRGTTETTLVMAPRNQVLAAVRDSWGRPVRDAQVELRGGDVLANESTNAAGQARLRFLKPGRYAVRVTREGYADLEESLSLEGLSGELVRWYTLTAK